MKKVKLKQQGGKIIACVLLVFLFGLFPENVFSQSLMDRLGAVKTDYIIISDTVKIPVLSQAIISRGVSFFDYGSHYDGAYGFGYGMQCYHLEFITTLELVQIQKKEPGRNLYYRINLIDNRDHSLQVVNLKLNDVKMLSSGNDFITYSFNLNSIPMVLFNEAKKLKIEKIKTY